MEGITDGLVEHMKVDQMPVDQHPTEAIQQHPVEHMKVDYSTTDPHRLQAIIADQAQTIDQQGARIEELESFVKNFGDQAAEETARSVTAPGADAPVSADDSPDVPFDADQAPHNWDTSRFDHPDYHIMSSPSRSARTGPIRVRSGRLRVYRRRGRGRGGR